MANLNERLIIGKNGIGKIQDNKCDDGAFVKKALSCNMEIYKLGKLGKPTSKADMEKRISQYFQICTDFELNPTVEGLALALNYERRSLWNIAAGRNSLPYQEIVLAAKDFICNYDSILATSNKLNSQIYAFRSKNFYGMKDQVQIEAISNQSGDMPKDANGILEELPEAPAIEVEKAE